MNIGIIDLDTSHPEAWAPILRELGHTLTGLWDGGSIHPPEYATAFARTHEIPAVYPTLEAMVPEVDCAIIHGADWDTHLAKARPFIEAGKAVFIDKPVAGSVADLRQFADWARQGARLTGGSALRFCNEVREWLARPEAERGTPHTVLAGCGVDEFNYGIHAYSHACALLGGGVESARQLAHGPQQRVELAWADGRRALLSIGKGAAWLPFHATVVTERSVHQQQPVPGDLYRALLEAVLPYLAGAAEVPPVPPTEWLEPELAALAVAQSAAQGGCSVALAEVSETTRLDGAAFATSYRKAKYGG